jgi:hypothetical protein
MAHAQGGQFGISPALQDVRGRPALELTPTRLTNRTQTTFAVRIFPVLLTQGIDGSFSFDRSARALNRAGLILSPSVTDLTMGPGDQRSVRLRWQQLPQGAREAYLGVVYEGTPKGQPQGTVSSVLRLMGVYFLRLPGTRPPTGRWTAFEATQFHRRLRFFPTLKNTGSTLGRPSDGRFTIRDAQGDLVLRKRLAPGVVLPGAQRQFPVDVVKVLPKGDYVAEARADFGSSRGLRIRKRFTLVGPNQLPTPELEMRAIAADAKIGDPARISGTMRSRGTAPAGTQVSITLERTRRGEVVGAPLDTARIRVAPIPPGASKEITSRLGPPLEEGVPYRATARFRDPQGRLQRLTTDFIPERELKQDDDGSPLVKPAIGLLILFVLLLLLWRMRHRQSRTEEALGRLNLNTATVEELAAFPGIGRAAAERIAAQRADSPFASVDDLVAVEGFDTERVEALREHLQA